MKQKVMHFYLIWFPKYTHSASVVCSYLLSTHTHTLAGISLSEVPVFAAVICLLAASLSNPSPLSGNPIYFRH